MIKIETNKGKAILYQGRTLWDTPKTYEKIDVLSHNIGNDYNSHLLILFKARDRSL